ncbi:MAG: response regulator transcription factor [Bacteroidetes bacterium]|jgi:DNA-binding NarL/FixJ family response regulator|nr:response regulator transcription factor [Bacteroidota bacterium]
MIKVGIVEDNNTLRKSLTSLFNDAGDMRCVMSLNNLLHIVKEIQKNSPDVILMDIGLPNISGIDGVLTVKAFFPSIQIMMFTVFEDADKIFDAIRNGASGYLLKKTPPLEIVEAVRDLNNGGAPMTASIARKVIQSFHVQQASTVEEYKLTPREKEILRSLVDGASYKKIADQYMVSISTIRTHICSIYNKLHVNSKAEAVAKILKQRQ